MDLVVPQNAHESAREPAVPAPDGAPVGLRTTAEVLALPPGFYFVTGAPVGAAHQLNGVSFPRVLLSTLPQSGAKALQFHHAGGLTESVWLTGAEAATLLIDAESAPLLLTTYSLSSDPNSRVAVELRRIDAPVAPAPVALTLASPRVKAHLQWLGDREFGPGEWASGGDRLAWIEGYSADLAPETAGFLDYCAVSAASADENWVPCPNYAGSRGRGAPLLGIRFRLKDAAAMSFSVRYTGRFLRHGEIEAADGELCRSPLRQDPLIALKVDIVPR